VALDYDVDIYYFMEVSHLEDPYTTPGGTRLTESHRYRWYHLPLDRAPEDDLFAGPHDRTARLDLEAVGSFAVAVVVRDSRPEWDTYLTAPGSTIRHAEVTFTR